MDVCIYMYTQLNIHGLPFLMILPVLYAHASNEAGRVWTYCVRVQRMRGRLTRCCVVTFDLPVTLSMTFALHNKLLARLLALL